MQLLSVSSQPLLETVVYTLTLVLLQYVILLALMLQPESAVHALINHSHWSDIFR